KEPPETREQTWRGTYCSSLPVHPRSTACSWLRALPEAPATDARPTRPESMRAHSRSMPVRSEAQARRERLAAGQARSGGLARPEIALSTVTRPPRELDCPCARESGTRTEVH